MELGIPKESADMFYTPINNDYWLQVRTPLVDLAYNEIPAWSLSALINMLPGIIKINDSIVNWYWFHLNKKPYQISYGNSLGLSGEWHDYYSSPQRENLVDVCFETIVWLKENNKI